MAMGPYITAASVLSAASILLLLVLLRVWVRNYMEFGTQLTLGLVAFGTVLLVENLLAVYFFFSTGMLYSGDTFAQQALVALRALQLAAIGFLTYVSMQ